MRGSMKRMNHRVPCSGKILYPGGSAAFGLARRTDIPQLARMYREIAVTRENAAQKFDAARTDSFRGSGGMFKIHSEATLRGAMKDSFFVTVRSGGRITASFWVSYEDPDFVEFRPDPRSFAGREAMLASLCRAIRNGLVAYPRELIVRPQSGIPALAHVMFYIVFHTLARLGFTHSLGVVYRVCGYAGPDGTHELSMLNERSFSVTASTGALRLGPLPRRTLRLEGLSVLIEPEAFDFDYEHMLPDLRERLLGRGITVRFDGEARL